jgi:hypothetical protein
MWIADIAWSVLDFAWQLIAEWLAIFAAPIFNTELLWISIPIWANWFFAEFYQEKKGTSYGNAISNGAIPLFVGIDWVRYLTYSLDTIDRPDMWMMGVKFAIAGTVGLYGLVIILFGIRGHEFVREAGRIREITYVLLMFTPIIYGVIRLNWSFVAEIIIFFPLWYLLIEYIDDKLPDPKVYKLDKAQDGRQIGRGPPQQPLRRVR